MKRIAWKRLWERVIGMRLALWLDKCHPDWCWADLCVNVGLGYDPFNWRDARTSGPKCQAECNGPLWGCYCGKMIHPRLRESFEKGETFKP